MHYALFSLRNRRGMSQVCSVDSFFFAVVCIPDRLIGSCSRCATHSRPDRTSSLRDPPTSLSSFFYDALSTFFFKKKKDLPMMSSL